MKKISIFLVALAAVLFFASSCSKKSSPAPSVCRITGIIAQGSNEVDTFSITYDGEGRVSVLKRTGGNSTTTSVYLYSGNTLRLSSSTNGSTTTDSIILNSDGLMVSDLKYLGSDKILTTNTFSGTQLQQQVTKKNNDPATTVQYVYTNGDLTSSSDGSAYVYDTSKPDTTGSYMQVLSISSAVPSIKVAHLLTGMAVGNDVQNYKYDYDNTGKITKMTLASSITGVTTYTYQYDCK